jgi:hypothetical protein
VAAPPTAPLLDYAEARARSSDPSTSHAAADFVNQKGRLNKTCALIMALLEDRPSGLTTHELADLTGISLVSVSPCLRPLARKGYVLEGEKRIPPGARVKSIAWVAKKWAPPMERN